MQRQRDDQRQARRQQCNAEAKRCASEGRSGGRYRNAHAFSFSSLLAVWLILAPNRHKTRNVALTQKTRWPYRPLPSPHDRTSCALNRPHSLQPRVVELFLRPFLRDRTIGKRLGQAVSQTEFLLHRGASKRNGKGVVCPRGPSNLPHSPSHPAIGLRP